MILEGDLGSDSSDSESISGSSSSDEESDDRKASSSKKGRKSKKTTSNNTTSAFGKCLIIGQHYLTQAIYS